MERIGVKPITINFDEHQLEDLIIIQGDTGTRGFLVTINDAVGNVIKAQEDLELRLYGVNENYPDRTIFTIAEIENDKYLAWISTNMASAMGKLQIQLALFKGSEKLIQTKIYTLQVNKSIAHGGELGKDLVIDFTLLTEAIERVEILEGKYEESLEEQTLIKEDVETKHTEVTTMHAELSTTLEKELERQASETARNTAEEERKTAESERKSSEEARKEAETDRQGKESARQSVEAGRVSAENARKTNEDVRVANENERKTAEVARASAESDRASAEIERADAESTRASNEETRVTTQTQRDATWEAWQDLIEDGILPPATPAIAGTVKIDKEGADTAASVDTMNTELAKKVDVVSGMGLSQNSYTTVEKNKLSGIESGANKYVHPETHSLDEITETATKKIMTDAERTKLEGIADNANNYTHPASHEASMITESTSRRFVSDTEKTTWNAKIGNHGNLVVENIAVINAGESTDDIPAGTLILELE